MHKHTHTYTHTHMYIHVQAHTYTQQLTVICFKKKPQTTALNTYVPPRKLKSLRLTSNPSNTKENECGNIHIPKRSAFRATASITWRSFVNAAPKLVANSMAAEPCTIPVYVCMYVCMHVCMHACMHVCMYACIHVCMRCT